MIHSDHRFHGLGSLRFVFQKGQTIRGQHCSLKYHLNERRQTFRVAVVVSRKVHKSAVVRNRIRRRVYEQVRTLTPKITKPYDLVLTVYNDQLADNSIEKLQQSLQELLKRAHVI